MTQSSKTSEADPRTLPRDAPQTHTHTHTDSPKQGVSEADNRTRPSNAEKDPDQWTTGDETMTGAQASYLQTLSEEAGEAFEPEFDQG